MESGCTAGNQPHAHDRTLRTEQALLIAGVGLNATDMLRSDVIDVAIDQMDGIAASILFRMIEQIRLQQPETEWFDAIRAVENLHTIHRIIVVFVVDNHALLNDDLLGCVAHVDHGKQMIRQI